MSGEAQQAAFFREMDKLRRGPKHIEALEVVRLARKVGLSPHDALVGAQKYTGYGQQRPSEMFDALATFVCALCSRAKVKRVLEYVAVPSVLTACLAEGHEGRDVSYLTPYDNVAMILRAAFDEKRAAVFQGVAHVKKDAVFDAIVCTAPLGHREQKDTDADGFGGEVVRRLVANIAEGGSLCWVSGRGAVFSPRPMKTLADLRSEGVNAVATIDVAPGGFPGTAIEGVVIILRREVPMKRFVGALRDIDTAEPMASAFLAGPSRKPGASWAWLDIDDRSTYAALEHSRLLQKLTPRGRCKSVSLASLLLSEDLERADRPIIPEHERASFLFIPEYAGSRVTADLEEQTVKLKAVYRLVIDSAKANPRFLARLLNGAYGRQLRAERASGATIQRVTAEALLALELPIPDMETQERIARIEADIGLLQSAFRDVQDRLDHDWTELSEVVETIDELKGVLDIERQIADWWRELPYPLATVYRRYQVSQNPKDRLDTLLHFFEVAGVYLATLGASHIRAMRKDWQEVMAKWLHPTGAAGIERADFGFWIGLAGASLKDVNRIASDKELRASAIEMAGPELVQVASTIGALGKASEILDVPRRHRNSWIGHGGHLKPSDAARLDGELQQSVRDLYEITASVFRHLQLVRPGMAEFGDSGFRFQIEKLSGSDPTFGTETVELDRPAKSKALAFWMRGARAMCPALPFFRLGAPQQPQETSFYVFNRVEKSGFRWISYQEAREQDFIAPDDELLRIIALGKNDS